MVKREFTFPSADGKTAIHAVEWLPEGAPRAVLQIAHGVSEYVLRYEDFAGYLTERALPWWATTIWATACQSLTVRPGCTSVPRAAGTGWWRTWSSSGS